MIPDVLNLLSPACEEGRNRYSSPLGHCCMRFAPSCHRFPSLVLNRASLRGKWFGLRGGRTCIAKVPTVSYGRAGHSSSTVSQAALKWMLELPCVLQLLQPVPDIPHSQCCVTYTIPHDWTGIYSSTLFGSPRNV